MNFRFISPASLAVLFVGPYQSRTANHLLTTRLQAGWPLTWTRLMLRQRGLDG